MNTGAATATVDRAKEALRLLSSLVWEYLPPSYWGDVERAFKDLEAVIALAQESSSSLEAALKRERALREKASAMYQALLTIREVAGRPW